VNPKALPDVLDKRQSGVQEIEPLETGNWKLEIGNRKLEIGFQFLN